MSISGSVVVVTVAGVDVTDHVLYSSARFESQTGAIPGTAEMILKDVDQTLDFTTGDEWTLDIDGVRLWGGYVLNAVRQFAFPAADTVTVSPSAVKVRQWALSGVDYNILFDKRVIHNPSDHFSHLPYFALDKTMGELLRDTLFVDYLDISGDGLDTSTLVDDTFVPRFDASGNPDPNGSKRGAWPTQGSPWRKVMDDFSQFGIVYYINPSKQIVFQEVETTAATWGFSDVPNKLPLPNASATYGMRDFEEVEDSSAMANDALVWGGSEWAGSSGGTVFARKQNSTSISQHGRWQYAETKFGELKDQGMVTARANVIVSGNTTGSVGGDTARGLAVDQKQIKITWYGHNVPKLSGVSQHLKPSDVVTFVMYVLSEDGINPLTTILPLRTMTITFPQVKDDGTSYVQFAGFFGLQISDPWWLWKYLRDIAPNVQPPPIVAVANTGTTAAIYGSFASTAFNESPDSSRKTFSINFAYIAGTTQVYLNGALQTLAAQYTESDPNVGEISFITAPTTGVQLWMTCRLAGGLP